MLDWLTRQPIARLITGLLNFNFSGEVNMVTLTRANRELFRRTPDECFDSFEALHRKACYDRENSVDRWIRPQEMLVTQQLGFCCDGQEFSLNDWSFSQVCKMSRVHRDTINRLSSQTASKAFEETLPRKEKPIQLLTRGELIRSVHGVTYTRLWLSLIHISEPTRPY